MLLPLTPVACAAVVGRKQLENWDWFATVLQPLPIVYPSCVDNGQHTEIVLTKNSSQNFCYILLTHNISCSGFFFLNLAGVLLHNGVYVLGFYHECIWNLQRINTALSTGTLHVVNLHSCFSQGFYKSFFNMTQSVTLHLFFVGNIFIP